jgi:hypothetical protein
MKKFKSYSTGLLAVALFPASGLAQDATPATLEELGLEELGLDTPSETEPVLNDSLPFMDLSALGGGIGELPAVQSPPQLETGETVDAAFIGDTDFGRLVDAEFSGTAAELRALREQVNPKPPKKEEARFKPEFGIRAGGRQWTRETDDRD